MKNKYFKSIIIVFSFCIVSISGCLDDNENKNNNKIETNILKRDLLKNVDTIYGKVNLSYIFYCEHQHNYDNDYFINISLIINEPLQEIKLIRIHYSEPVPLDGMIGAEGGGGENSMDKIDRNSYAVIIPKFGDILDLWIDLYSYGEQIWDEINQSYYYKSIRKVRISAVISLDHFTSDMQEKIAINIIKYGFDAYPVNYYNISFKIIGTINPKMIVLHYERNLINKSSVSLPEKIFGTNNGNYYIILKIHFSELNYLKDLYFSIAFSNIEGMRVTSSIYNVTF